jgi:hypothetical protein
MVVVVVFGGDCWMLVYWLGVMWNRLVLADC